MCIQAQAKPVGSELRNTEKGLANLIFTVWFPHSGGRIFNRGLLPLFPDIKSVEIFNPFLLRSVDQILRLDTTEQVHKHRSLSDLKGLFDIVYDSIAVGREEGLDYYFSRIRELGEGYKYVGGALPCGADVANFDFELIGKLCPTAKFIHLVRHPAACLDSFRKRKEFDGDEHRILHSWLAFNHRAIVQLNERALVVRYEDLVSNSSSVIAEVADWLGLELPREMVDFESTYYGIAESLSDPRGAADVIPLVDAICGETLSKLGY
jgi:hypothetical protein